MKCQNCWYDIPAGNSFCPNCGTPVPSESVPPTVAASPTPPPITNPYSQPYENTPPAYTPPPPTGYGSPSSPYGAPQSAPYGVPQQPYGGTPGGYIPPQQMGQPKKRNGCVIALVVVGIIFLLVVGGIITGVVLLARGASKAVSNYQATATAIIGTVNVDTTPTAATTDTGGVPTKGQVDPNALLNIPQASTASNVDDNDKPVDNKTQFAVGDTVYIALTFSGVKAGYTIVKIYRDGESDVDSDISSVDATPGYNYFTLTINNPGDFVAGVYWCNKSDCSDAALAQVLTFSAS